MRQPTTIVLTLLTCLCTVQFNAAPAPSPSFIENDSIVFPDSDNNDTAHSEVTNKLNECIQDNFKIEFNGQCRPLLTVEGACPEDKWLVLDLPLASLPKPKVKGKCVDRKCSPKEHYWVAQNRCVFPNESSTLCPKGNKIDTDYFGEGFCDCIKEPIHARDNRNKICFPVYTRGPCSGNKVWTKVNNRMDCYTDNCTVTRARFPGKIIVPWTDGKCYAVSEQGPCVQGYVIRVNMWSLRPECGDPLTALHLIDPPCTGVDYSGKCSRPISTTQNLFYSKIAEQARAKGHGKALSDPK